VTKKLKPVSIESSDFVADGSGFTFLFGCYSHLAMEGIFNGVGDSGLVGKRRRWVGFSDRFSPEKKGNMEE